MRLQHNRVFASLVFLSWALLLYPFPVAVFFAMCIACFCLPFYRRLSGRMRSSRAMFVVIALSCLALALPVALVVSMVLPQAVNGMRVLDQLRESGWLHGQKAQSFLDSVDYYLRLLPGMDDGLRHLTRQAAELAGTAVRATLAGGVGLAANFLNLALQVFLMFALSMVFMLYAPLLHDYARIIIQCPGATIDRFVLSIRSALHAVLTGVLLVAALQGLLCGIAFTLTGVPQAAFWGLLSAFVAPVPVIGTAAVWLPACLYLWFTGSSGAAVFLLVWCVVLVAGVDNFMRPHFLRGGIRAPFLVILLTVICGLIAFGPVGLVAGPVLMAFALQAAREAVSTEEPS
jgi:predicted PurR-regulated permease PerM